MTVRVGEGLDAGAAWHYGDPFREQRALALGTAGVDLSHRPVFTVAGPDRLRWLNDITSQDLASLPAGQPTSAWILDAHGHLVHALGATDDGAVLWCHTEPGRLEALLTHLRRMVFAARVEIADVGDEYALVVPPSGPPSGEPVETPGTPVAVTSAGQAAGSAPPLVVPRDHLDVVLGDNRAGTWALEALRIASGTPRAFLDTDERTIPNELANPDADRLGPAVHLRKGCYPGQETVARVYNLGRPPRRLTLLHLDGSAERLPAVGADVLVDGRPVGRMGTSQRHHELGPIGLALLKRTVPTDAELVTDGIAAAQEVLVDPESGLHWRPEPGVGRR